MNALDLSKVLPPTPPEIQSKIRQATEKIKPYEATFRVRMSHVLHAGMYARTASIDAEMAFTSVLIKVPTILIVKGECAVYAGDKWHLLSGYNVIAASAGRMQAYVTFSESEITMVFPTQAKTVEEAENEMSDEAENLLSRRA